MSGSHSEAAQAHAIALTTYPEIEPDAVEQNKDEASMAGADALVRPAVKFLPHIELLPHSTNTGTRVFGASVLSCDVSDRPEAPTARPLIQRYLVDPCSQVRAKLIGGQETRTNECKLFGSLLLSRS
ncbi:MAG: hypothetical protein C4297_00790 [Gemmataceae bacterium]